MSQRHCLILFLKYIILPISASVGNNDCGGHFNSNSGNFKYPSNRSDYLGNQDCSWHIESSGARIELKFTKFNTVPGDDFVYIRDGENSDSPLLEKFSGEKLPPSLRTTTNKAFIRFTSDKSGTREGFSLTWETIDNRACGDHFNGDSGSIMYPVTSGHYPNHADCNWVIDSNGAGIEIQFTRFDTEPEKDFVYIRDRQNSKVPELGKYSGSTLPSSVKTKSNKAFIKFTSDIRNPFTGFSLIWNILDSTGHKECGDYLNSDSGTIKHPMSGGHYQSITSCSWVIVTSGARIELKFTSLSTEADCDFVYIRDGESTSSHLIGKYSGTTLLPSSVRTTTNKAFIQFTSDHSSENRGFALDWNTVDDHDECGNHINMDNGSIQYPETGESYPNEADCIWVIVTSGASIELKFTKFSTKKDHDFVYVRDGESRSSRRLGKFSGTLTPSIVRTTSNKAFIHFTSDNRITSTGFAVTWKTVDDVDTQVSTISASISITPHSEAATGSFKFIITGVILAIILIFVVATTIFFYLKKRKIKDQQENSLVDLPTQQLDPGMGNRHDSENSLYGAMPETTEPQVPNRGSRHDSENSLYGATLAKDA
ncbi:unnamed protein product, partial [Meganyctiphanes norvegica]